MKYHDDLDVLPPEEPLIQQPVSDAFSWRHVIAQLKHATVRDLAFLLLSPPLLHPHHQRWAKSVQMFDQEELRLWRRWLLIQDMAPAAIERFLSQEANGQQDGSVAAPAAPLRLGHYAEKLLAFALSNAPAEMELKLLARNIPLQALGARTTTGELDFVVEHKGEVQHWEMAVKFYLCTGSLSLDDFVSPNAFIAHTEKPAPVDTLGMKLSHMFGKQLATQSLLSRSQAPEFNIAQPITRSLAYIRGWLFYPAFARGLSASSVPTDWALHPQHPHGIWIENRRAPLLQSGSWMELPRLGWLSPAKVVKSKQGGYPIAAMPLRKGEKMRQPSLWAQLKKVDDSSRQEIQRVFAVPDIGS